MEPVVYFNLLWPCVNMSRRVTAVLCWQTGSGFRVLHRTGRQADGQRQTDRQTDRRTITQHRLRTAYIARVAGVRRNTMHTSTHTHAQVTDIVRGSRSRGNGVPLIRAWGSLFLCSVVIIVITVGYAGSLHVCEYSPILQAGCAAITQRRRGKKEKKTGNPNDTTVFTGAYHTDSCHSNPLSTACPPLVIPTTA